MSTSKSVMRSQRKKKLFAVEAMGGKCQICGYDKCINALEFHHVDESSKSFSPSYIIMRWSWERAKEELSKCILVCSNCHKEIHYKELDIDPKNYIKPFVTLTCNFCKNTFETRRKVQQYCSVTCNKLDIRKVVRPSKNELHELIYTYRNWKKIGSLFGVADNTVKKWARKYGLPSRTKDL